MFSYDEVIKNHDEHRESCDTMKRHQGEDVFSKSGQKHNKSEKQTRKSTRAKKNSKILKKRNTTSLNEKNKSKDVSFMHNHTLHDTSHQIYVLLSITGMQGEKESCTR